MCQATRLHKLFVSKYKCRFKSAYLLHLLVSIIAIVDISTHLCVELFYIFVIVYGMYRSQGYVSCEYTLTETGYVKVTGHKLHRVHYILKTQLLNM